MKENVAEFLKFRYEKLKLLKRSERGEVWLAQARQSGELVIIKRVESVGLPYELIKKFSFTLPAKVLYCAEDESETIIVEEFIQGESLHERKNFLSESQARGILLQMCDGLKELHEQKIIHRDIKPSNLILQGERIRLIDFDAARIFKEGKEADTHRLGTKGYAPPEQYGEGQTDPRSDIYSLGVTMKELVGTDCGERLKTILNKCTEYDPKNRFQSVDELKDALTTEEFDEPAELTEQEPRRLDLFLLAARVLLFMIRREFHTELIILTIIIFLLASSPTLNSGENFQESIAKLETFTEEEPQEISQPVQGETFKLPEVITPPQSEVVLPSVEPPKEYTPPPRQTFSKDDLKLPTMPAPNEPSYEPPINFNRRRTSSGLLQTKLYLNDSLFDQFEHINDNIKITRAQWSATQLRLHITNDTDALWLNPKIKFVIGQNWGDGKITQTRELPTLASGESTEFIIPFNLLSVSDRENTSAYFQIWLDGDESKMNEHYWGAWFDIVD